MIIQKDMLFDQLEELPFPRSIRHCSTIENVRIESAGFFDGCFDRELILYKSHFISEQFFGKTPLPFKEPINFTLLKVATTSSSIGHTIETLKGLLNEMDDKSHLVLGCLPIMLDTSVLLNSCKEKKIILLVRSQVPKKISGAFIYPYLFFRNNRWTSMSVEETEVWKQPYRVLLIRL